MDASEARNLVKIKKLKDEKERRQKELDGKTISRNRANDLTPKVIEEIDREIKSKAELGFDSYTYDERDQNIISYWETYIETLYNNLCNHYKGKGFKVTENRKGDYYTLVIDWGLDE